MVPARPALMLAAWLGLGLIASAADVDTIPTAARVEPLERRPYRIRAWVVADPSARIDGRGREKLIADWRALARRFVGPAWELEAASGDGPLAAADLDRQSAGALGPLATDRDKLWMLLIRAEGSGFVLSGREFDAATKQLGPIRRLTAPHPSDAPRGLLRLSLDVFAPRAEVGETVGGDVLLTVQGAALPSPDPIGRVVAPGTVFRPFRAFLKPDGSILRLDPIIRTYLPVESIDGAVARCGIVSVFRDPLSRKAVQKTKLAALGVKPSAVPTRLRFVVSGPERPPAAGYTLTTRAAPNGTPREVGTTDRGGRIALPPDFADGLVILRLLAAGVEPLTEFPLMPGETAEEVTIVLGDVRASAVAVATELNSLRDEVVDLVARRARLEAKLKARAEGEVWDEVALLLDEYRALPTRASVAERLTKIEDGARREQTPRQPVLTKSVQALLTDTKALVDSYLDDDALNAYTEALQQSKTKPATKAESPKDEAPAAEAVAGLRPSPSADDAQAIQGTWAAVSIEVDGQRPPASFEPSTASFQGQSLVIGNPDGTSRRGTFRLDPARLPKEIDVTFEGQPRASLGIYELAGDRLTICLGTGANRPALFSTKPRSNSTLTIYERRAATEATSPPRPGPPDEQGVRESKPSARPKGNRGEVPF